MSLTELQNVDNSSWLYLVFIRFVEAGSLVILTPGLCSVFGRIGLGTKPPPQFGQTFLSIPSTQAVQKVHS